MQHQLPGDILQRLLHVLFLPLRTTSEHLYNAINHIYMIVNTQQQQQQIGLLLQ